MEHLLPVGLGLPGLDEPPFPLVEGPDPAQLRGRLRHGATASLEASGRAVTLVGCYHVSQQNTFTGRLTRSMLDDVLAEARRLAAG